MGSEVTRVDSLELVKTYSLSLSLLSSAFKTKISYNWLAQRTLHSLLLKMVLFIAGAALKKESWDLEKKDNLINTLLFKYASEMKIVK